MTPNSVPITLRWGFVVIPVALIAIGVAMLAVTWYRSRRWHRRQATVVDGSFTRGVGPDLGSSGYTALVLEWVGDDGRSRRHTETVHRTRLRVPVGKRIPILVDPTRPDHIQRANPSGYALAFILVGLGFLAARTYLLGSFA